MTCPKRLTVGLCLIAQLVACSSKDEVPGANGEWVLEAVDQGAARATGQGFSFDSPDELWFAAEQIVPGLAMDFPASGVPLSLWDLAQYENIADIGSCPYSVVVDESLVWKTGGCRSQGGYEWTGELAEREGQLSGHEGWKEYRWEMGLEIVGDIEDPTFERLTLDGDLRVVRGDGESLEVAVQVNAQAGVDGYWERVNITDARERAWADWVMTARFEQSGTGVKMEGLVDLGELGGLAFQADALIDNPSCSGEPDGTLTLFLNETEHRLTFDGSTSCDRCVDLSIDGEFAGRSCGS